MFSGLKILTERIVIRAVIFFSILFISSCGGVSVAPSSSDKAPTKQVDVSKVPNAVPKDEPRSRYGNPKSYVVFDKRYYVMESNKGFVEKGLASWYGTKFHGRRTSSGETYDMYAMTAAHKNLPLPTYVQVTNLNNGKQIIVKVNDRGPFHENRIIDLSYTAAIKLDIVKKGTGLVEIRTIGPGQTIVADSAVGAPVENTPTISNDDGFFIQVGSFSNLVNAEGLKQKLAPIGKDKINISQVVVSGNTLYRVRIGPLTDIDQADAIVSNLTNYDVNEHRIVTN
jgi:peptidoglycan lytic transglycosylase